MVELEKIYRKQRNNREILPKLLQILDERAVQIDERVAQLVALKKEIREYQQRLRNKVLQDATHEEPRNDRKGDAHMKEVVITGAARTAIGSLMGGLSELSAPRLGAVAIAEAVSRSGIRKEDVEQVIMGNVLSAGMGQAPARQAGIYAGIPVSAGALTINKMCGSGLKAVMLAAQSVVTEEFDVQVAGGMESMSQAPYLLKKARSGYRLGNDTLYDHMIIDGLWDVYNDLHMGNCAETLAKEHKITREEQDAFAASSYTRAACRHQEREIRRRDRPGPDPAAQGRPGAVPGGRGAWARERAEAAPLSGPRSRRTAPSPPGTPRRSTTGRRPWS